MVRKVEEEFLVSKKLTNKNDVTSGTDFGRTFDILVFQLKCLELLVGPNSEQKNKSWFARTVRGKTQISKYVT